MRKTSPRNITQFKQTRFLGQFIIIIIFINNDACYVIFYVQSECVTVINTKL